MKIAHRFLILQTFVFSFLALNAQEKKPDKLSPRKEFVKPIEYITEVKGMAPNYIGLEVNFYQIEDYVSQKEIALGSAIVGKDSTFRTAFMLGSIQRILVKVGKAKSFIYAEPKAKYTLLFRSKSSEVKGLQADLSISFLGLDETDINYKILDYTAWENQFLSANYTPNATGTTDFLLHLDTFKMKVQSFYEKDTSFFLKEYIRFSLASLDNLDFLGARNKFEKYDFYIKNAQISYENDVYMRYINSYYKKYISMVSNNVNKDIYQGVLAASPKAVMIAMGKDYTLDNLRLRELVMIKSLSEIYYTGDFPQTNILTILDSVARFALFEKNKVIAKNCIERLAELNPGSKAPDFAIQTVMKETKTLRNYNGKHLYISFFDPNSVNTNSELTLLEALHKKYSAYVMFLTIVKPSAKPISKELTSLPWDVYLATDVSDIMKKYKAVTFPNYVFIDANGDLVASPALKPSPNAKGDNIDKVFFNLATLIEYNKSKENTGLPKGK